MDILPKIVQVLNFIFHLTGILCILATFLVRLTPTDRDDKVIGRFAKWFFLLMHFMPTIGLNPKTKKMKNMLDQINDLAEEDA